MKETSYWTWHIITGCLMILLLGLHMVIMHLDVVWGIFCSAGGEAIAWENVITRSKQISFIIIYTLLLGAALYHGLYGCRTILFELNLNEILQKLVNIFFWILGVGLFLIGTCANVLITFVDYEG